MIFLCDKELSVRISERGAELCGAMLGGREYIWQGDAAVWGWHSPVLFPVCGRLWQDRYRWAGKTYGMHMHGFAREKTFAAKQISPCEAVFSLRDDEETLSQYPFPFLFEVRYTLSECRLCVRYTVRNTGGAPMYWSAGAHAAFRTETNGDWSVAFEKAEDLTVRELISPGYLGSKKIRLAENVRTLPIGSPFFAGESLVLENLRSAFVVLRRGDQPVVTAEFSEFPVLVLWQKEGAPFFCIEPWNGLPDRANTDGELSRKEGISALSPGEERSMAYSLRFHILQ